jgi:predicted Zn-dependent protease
MEWNNYLPLQEINRVELADIVILRASVEREIQLNSHTGLYNIPRTITAQTNYKFYIRKKNRILAHKMTIQISPDLGELSTLAAARHELGHALGIWGHSDRETDALYFSQVKDTPTISVRDINTLQKIYQQPTKLGWAIK